MALVVGWECMTTPLTREVFGEDGKREIVGCIEPLDHHGEFVPKNFVLTSNNGKEIYLHPTLFLQYPAETFWVKLTLRDGKICMQPVEPFTNKVEGDRKWFDVPVELKEVSVEAFMLLQKKVSEEKGCECCGKGRLYLGHIDILTAVITTDEYDQTVYLFCGDCYDKLMKENDPKVHFCLLDGRKIPFLSKVKVYQ